MKLIGTFNEAQIKAGEDKTACANTEKDSGGRLRYFIPKLRRSKGKIIVEVYAMTTEEYCNSPII